MNPAFFKALRQRDSGVFGTSLSQAQVDGISAIIEVGRGLPASHIAHVFGEVYHETGGGMYPVKETVFPYSKDKNPSDATVIARLDRAFAKGQLPWVSKPYWRGGMFGRGQIQATHEYNYRKLSPIVGVDLVAHPERALELPISAAIAVKGCVHGVFTGKKLADYDHETWFDHVGARAIVNGDKNKREKGSSLTNGQKVAAYARAFEAALIAGGWQAGPSRQTPALPVPELTVEPTVDTSPPPAIFRGFKARIFAFLKAAFGKAKS